MPIIALGVADCGERQAFASHPEGDHLGAMFTQGFRHLLLGILFYQKDDAAATSCATDLGGTTAVTACRSYKFVNEWRGNSGSVSAAQFPFFAQQACNIVPIGIGQGVTHGDCDLSDLLEIAANTLVAVHVGFEDLPIIYAGLAWRIGVCQQEAGLDFFRSDRQTVTVTPVG